MFSYIYLAESAFGTQTRKTSDRGSNMTNILIYGSDSLEGQASSSL